MTVCQTRIHGLGTATSTYLAEWDNNFPINGLIMPKDNVPSMYSPGPNQFTAAEQTNQQKWRPEFGALWPYMGGQTPLSTAATTFPMPPMPSIIAKEYLCPNDTFNRTGTAGSSNFPLIMKVTGNTSSSVVSGPGPGGYWSYSVNGVLNSLGRFRNYFTKGLGWADPLKFTNIANPGNFIYFVEEDEASPFNDEVFDAPAFGGGDRITNRHNNGGYLGFGDGHAEWVSEVVFDQGGGNSTGTTPYQAMQSPWTRSFFPDGGEFATPP